MPRLLIYEECLAAGTAGPLGDEAKQFLPEGLAMTLAVAADFAKLPGWQVRVMRSTELIASTTEQVLWAWVDVQDDLDTVLAREVVGADWTLVIAPECGGLLQQRAQGVIDAGGKLLGPSPEFIALASDKTATLQQLSEYSFPLPHGMHGTLSDLSAYRGSYPAVIKPNDGAGSSGIRCVADQQTLQKTLQELAKLFPSQVAWRCEEFVTGQAASVAILSGGQNFKELLPMTQTLAFDQQGQAHYQGGTSTLSDIQQARAIIWGIQVWLVLPNVFGYIGIDLILGNADDGSQDAILEVNPRLTTSYLGLRAATDDSLAEAMWRIALGETVNIAWLPNTVEFTKQGQVSIRERS